MKFLIFVIFWNLAVAGLNLWFVAQGNNSWNWIGLLNLIVAVLLLGIVKDKRRYGSS